MLHYLSRSLFCLWGHLHMTGMESYLSIQHARSSDGILISMILTTLLVVEILDIRQRVLASLNQVPHIRPPPWGAWQSYGLALTQLQAKTPHSVNSKTAPFPYDVSAHDQDLYPVLLLATSPRALCQAVGFRSALHTVAGSSH